MRPSLILLSFLCLQIIKIITQELTIDFSAPIDLSPSNQNINSIDLDQNNNFIVSYQSTSSSGFLLTYSSELQKVDFMTLNGQSSKYQQARRQSNAPSIQEDVILNSLNQSIYIYDKTTKLLKKQYDYALPVLAYEGFVININGQNVSFVVALTTKQVSVGIETDQTKITLNGSPINSMPNFITDAGFLYHSEFQCINITCYLQTIFFYSQNDDLTVNKIHVIVQISTSDPSNFYTIARMHFYSNIFSTAIPLSSFIKYNQFIYCQDSAGDHYLYDYYQNRLGEVDQALPTSYTLGISDKNKRILLIQSGQIFQIAFNYSISKMQIVVPVMSFPSDNYRVVSGPHFTLIYIKYSTKVYEITDVTNNPVPSNLTNGTNTTKQANSTNITVDFNSTNATVDFNSSNATVDFNSTNATVDFNSTNASLQDFIIQTFFQDQSLQKTLEITTQALQQVIPIPGARRIISPLFYFFSCFDDLYLYQFHDRKYGKTMTKLFNFVNSIENQKWAFFNYTNVLNILGISVQGYNNITAYQQDYQTYNFTSVNHTRVGSQGLLVNCNNLFIVILPILITGFIAFRILFKILFNYPASIIFRKFDFIAFLLLLLFDGNIQQLSFYMTSEWLHLFHFNFAQKISKMIIVLFGFVLLMMSVAFFFVCYATYKKLNRILMDNNRNRLSGVLFLTLQICFRNFYLGSLNSFLRIMGYPYMMAVLIGSQILFLFVFAISISCKIYKQKSKMWIYVILNAFKIVLLITFLFDYDLSQTPRALQDIQMYLITLQLGIFMIGIVFQGFSCLWEIKSMIKILFCHQNKEKDCALQQTKLKKQCRTNMPQQKIAFIKIKSQNIGISQPLSNKNEKQIIKNTQNKNSNQAIKNLNKVIIAQKINQNNFQSIQTDTFSKGISDNIGQSSQITLEANQRSHLIRNIKNVHDRCQGKNFLRIQKQGIFEKEKQATQQIQNLYLDRNQKASFKISQYKKLQTLENSTFQQLQKDKNIKSKNHFDIKISKKL